MGDSHLGHVFADGSVEEGCRRCWINSAVLRLVPYADLEPDGWLEYQRLLTLPR